MSFLFTEVAEGQAIEITISDKLTKQVYQALLGLTEAAIKKHGEVRVLLVMLGFRGWNISAKWDEIGLDRTHLSRVERLGIVGEPKFEKGMELFCNPFVSAEVKFFEQSNLDLARGWIRGANETAKDRQTQ